GEPLGEVTKSDLNEIGVVAQVVSAAKGRDEGAVVVVLRGLGRAKLESIAGGPLAKVRVSAVAETATADEELDALFLNLRHAVHEVMDQLRLPEELATQIDAIASASELADFVSARLDIPVAEKLEILSVLDVKARVLLVLTKVVRRREVLKIRKSIDSQIQSDMGKKQREHILREQMKAIERELGEEEGEDGESDVDALAARIAAAKLSEEAREMAEKQMKRLRSLQSGSPEFGTVRTYLEWIVDLPWTEESPDSPDVAAVRAVLDADHFGLEKVKRRILEYLAVRKLKSDKKGPILCLIGPPGVGKTSLGRSIAGALGRKFHRISLGGVHDEAAIRGHRRTYVGALPGNVIHGMKKVGVTNPVFMLDEVDKLGQGGLHGDPSSALLEVLDPEQNDTFADHYLEIPYDLSNVMFIATANVGDTIPEPLRDRMEIIEIPGYTRLEKLAIARRHLVPKQLREHGLDADRLEITDQALALVIDRYTREAGVRSLEKQLASIARGVAVRIAEGKDEPVVVRDEESVRAFLGQARQDDQRIERTSEAGVATGLAWTPVGGTILFVEATRMPGSGKLTLTGQLGDVMKESAMAALSYVRANTGGTLARFGIPRDFLDKADVHIHVPAGAMPKDGPSAGVTLVSALVSVLTGIRVRHDVAMTGEITLRGRVLPIGGLKEKVLAAHRAGIKRVIAPARNAADIEEIPEEVKREVEFVFVSHIDEVIEAALEDVAPPRRAPAAVDATPAAALS
ncbi:MAG TPA: endopeptidase La, partial [Polyangiaceae bacterium]|nr:endopeptidase La [Polyangiaceae bacterium]